MMRRRQRGGEVLVATVIPSDLLIEILKKVPIKLLARFKCVSKFWYSLIHSQLFPSPPRLYISLGEPSSVLLSLASISENTDFDLDMVIDGIGGCDIVAFRGLILYLFRGHACIYNPTTGQRVTLPAIEFNFNVDQYINQYMKEIYYFLRYDPVLDQYKVVCTAVVVGEFSRIEIKHWVFVLEARSSWKRIEFDHPHFPQRERVFINGVIYYLAECSVYSRIVISFEVRTEEFSMIQLPSVVYEYLNSWNLELIKYGGKPTIFDYRNLRDFLLNLWILEDAGKWSKKSLVVQPRQMHFFPTTISFEVIGTTQNGEVVLKPHKMMPYSSYILYYDLHKNDVRRVDIRGISKEPFDMSLMDTGESIVHLKI